ncbi:MAG: nitroreductase family protein [Silvanigrellales bacterium]|jgi:nitroreductase|nr:nitroreductase family protein [Silvanigrellales bacterium]
MTFLTQLNWRDATKMFDANKKVADSDLAKVLEAIRMAPTSFGLQPFYVRVVKDEATKKKLQDAGWGQAQFPTSTAVFVFVARNDVMARIDAMLESRTGGDASKRAAMKDYEGMMKGFASALTPADLKTWAQKQAYIALGFGLAAAAELGIASCPIEGFSAPDFDKILGLPEGHFSTVVLAVGHASANATPFPKWRFPSSDIIRS